LTIPKYWLEDHDAPFAELLRVVQTQCHPETYDYAYEDLVEWAGDPEVEERLAPFKEQLRQALRDPSQVPAGALWTAACYDDGSDEKFLRRLWRDLYGDEVP
jgi:hypothetical protein